MIAYTMVGTNNLKRAGEFYDALFAPLGIGRLLETAERIFWGTGLDKPVFAVAKPYDGKPATVGNGVMIALLMKDLAQIEQIHKLALELGGTTEGAPGPRGPRFYSGYFRDLDGNKINLFHYEP